MKTEWVNISLDFQRRLRFMSCKGGKRLYRDNTNQQTSQGSKLMKVGRSSVKYFVLKPFQAKRSVKIMSHISNKGFV